MAHRPHRLGGRAHDGRGGRRDRACAGAGRAPLTADALLRHRRPRRRRRRRLCRHRAQPGGDAVQLGQGRGQGARAAGPGARGGQGPAAQPGAGSDRRGAAERAARRRRRRHRRAGGRIDRGPDPRLRPQRAAPGRFRRCARRWVRRHRPRLPAVGRDAASRAARVLPQRVRGAPPAHPGRGDRAGRHRRRSRHLRGRFRQPDRQHGGSGGASDRRRRDRSCR